MKRSPVVQKRRHSETTDPWPSVARLQVQKPRLVVALERRPSKREHHTILETLRGANYHAMLDVTPGSDGSRATVRLGQQVTEVHEHAGAFDVDDLLPHAQWTEQERERLGLHEAHIVCAPKTSSPNPYEQYLNLYRIAWAYGKAGGLCGVVNPLAAAFTSPVAVQNLISDEMVDQCRRQLPPQLFTGFARYHATGGVWCATKGFEVFGVPNLAYFLTGAAGPLGQFASADWVFAELWKLFLFAYEEGGVLTPGHEVTFCDGQARSCLRRVSDVVPGWEPQLETPGGTLVLVPTARRDA